MSDNLTLAQKWLRQNIRPYAQKDIVYTHVDSVLNAYTTLRPKTDVYTYDDGRSQLMLCVHGLLPITYRNTSYNIPIAVWLSHQYPNEPPLVYVVPTSDMLVKAGRLVDTSGRCHPAYIQSWKRKSEGCNLNTLMEALVDQFSREPPVYAKPRTSTSARPQESPFSVNQSSDYSNRRPPIPPRPDGPSSPPAPKISSPPPVPNLITRPTSRSPPAIPHHTNPRQNVYHPPRSVSSSPLAPAPPTYTTPPPHTPSTSNFYTGSLPTTQGSPIPTLPLSPLYAYSHSEPPPHEQSLHQPGHLPSHHIRQHLAPQHLSAPQNIPPVPHLSPPRNLLDEDVEDVPAAPPTTVPPRPPNPEVLRMHSDIQAKFLSEFTFLNHALAADMQRLQTTQSDLLAGEPAIRDEMARLEAVRDVCRVVGSRYRNTVETAEMNLNELRKKGDPEVDELICSTTIVYNQLIDLVAEDNAIEDTIYHLHRALNAGRIDLDKFLRTTRALAEEQFMKRALAEKIVASIPMGAWS